MIGAMDQDTHKKHRMSIHETLNVGQFLRKPSRLLRSECNVTASIPRSPEKKKKRREKLARPVLTISIPKVMKERWWSNSCQLFHWLSAIDF
jgi:hypothetical protein